MTDDDHIDFAEGQIPPSLYSYPHVIAQSAARWAATQGVRPMPMMTLVQKMESDLDALFVAAGCDQTPCRIRNAVFCSVKNMDELRSMTREQLEELPNLGRKSVDMLLAVLAGEKVQQPIRKPPPARPKAEALPKDLAALIAAVKEAESALQKARAAAKASRASWITAQLEAGVPAKSIAAVLGVSSIAEYPECKAFFRR